MTPFVTYAKTKKIVMSRMTFIDNKDGYTALITNKPQEYDGLEIESNDILIIGESESPDCPPNGGFCGMYHKTGLLSPIGVWGGKKLHLDMLSPLPPHNVMSIAVW